MRKRIITAVLCTLPMAVLAGCGSIQHFPSEYNRRQIPNPVPPKWMYFAEGAIHTFFRGMYYYDGATYPEIFAGGAYGLVVWYKDNQLDEVRRRYAQGMRVPEG